MVLPLETEKVDTKMEQSAIRKDRLEWIVFLTVSLHLKLWKMEWTAEHSLQKTQITEMDEGTQNIHLELAGKNEN